MDYIMILLRLLHIIAGIFWVGSALTTTQFLLPTAGATAEAGPKFMQHLMFKAGLSTMMAAAGGTTVLAGAILYWLDSHGFTSAWTTSGPGIGFGLGGIMGLLGFIFGMMVSRSNMALGKLGAQIQGQPTSDQAAQLAALRKRMSNFSLLNTVFLVLAIALMASSRYLVF